MEVPYRFAICNEVFGTAPLPVVCKQVRALGYHGLELAPHTLAEDATSLTGEQRKTIKNEIEDAGLEFVGLHWLLVSPAYLHITTPDESRRNKSWEYVHRSIDLCADLVSDGAKGKAVIVLGSPKQRSTTGGMSIRQAIDIIANGLAHAAGHAETRGVTLLLESISPADTDVVNCLGDAVQIVKQIGSPAVQTMFDVHNSVSEREGHLELVRRYFSYLRHVHVNELDGSEPGFRDYDFRSLLTTLTELEYDGFVSVEAFDMSRPGEEIARRALQHLRSASASNESAMSQSL